VMDVRVRLTWRIAWLVHMLMVLVVPVKMFMSHCFMVMRVSVAFGKMKPDAYGHETACCPEKRQWPLTQYDQ
jgi:hypothetical protein